MVKTNTTKKGKLLEEEVANIYRLIDGVKVVTENYYLMGVQIDVYVEIESQDGIINRYAIDAKNYDTPVNSDIVRKCINDFTMLKNHRQIDQGIIVSATGFTKDSRSSAETSHIKLVDIKDLRLKISNFSNYLEKWIQRYESLDIFKNDNYIPLTVRNEEGSNLGDLEKYFFKWLNSEGCHITLLGNYGTGKSTSLQRLMWLQSKKYLENPYKERIPIFVDLKRYRQAPRAQALITDILVNEFDIKINYSKFIDRNENGDFVIFLDGFDEMAERVLDGYPEEHFKELSSLACEKGKVILSSRTHYFKDHQEVLCIHEQETNLYKLAHDNKGFQILFLNPFSEKDIHAYLKASFSKEWEYLKKVIEETYDLKSLAEVPILLNMMVQTLPDMIREGEKINRSSIYHRFTDKWLQREKWRHSLGTRERLEFCIKLALHFYKYQLNSVHWKELPDLIREYFGNLINLPGDVDVFEYDVRTSNFLVREEQGGQYSFVHKSFMEYFVARFFFENIRRKVANGLDDLKDFVKSKVIWEFLLEMVGNDELKFLKKEVFFVEGSSTSDLMSEKISLTKNVYTSSESKGNCAFLLIHKNISLDNSNIESARLSDVTLNNISIKNAILSNTNFERSKLIKVSFVGSTFTFSNFKNSELKEVDFTGANLNGANFLNAIIDDKTLKTIAFSKYWGNIKISSAYKKHIQNIYTKSSVILAAGTQEETSDDDGRIKDQDVKPIGEI